MLQMPGRTRRCLRCGTCLSLKPAHRGLPPPPPSQQPGLVVVFFFSPSFPFPDSSCSERQQERWQLLQRQPELGRSRGRQGAAGRGLRHGCSRPPAPALQREAALPGRGAAPRGAAARQPRPASPPAGAAAGRGGGRRDCDRRLSTEPGAVGGGCCLPAPFARGSSAPAQHCSAAPAPAGLLLPLGHGLRQAAPLPEEVGG